jgi:predicted phage tail protein
MPRQIIGSKGGGGGSSFVTKPDSLRSNDSFEILLGLGSGRWKGMVDGLKSLKINGVPLENTDGTSNFQDVYAVFADGNPLENQIVNFKLGGGGNSQSVTTQLVNTNTNGPGGWVTGAVSTPNANFIDLRFIVQQLFYQDDKSIRENTATIEVEMRPSGGNWINIFSAPSSQGISYDPDGYDYYEDDGNYNARLYLGRGLFNSNGTGFRASSNPNLKITGKTSSAFAKELRIAVPNKGAYANKTWEVRARLVEKDTIDNDPISERRNIVFETVTAIITEPLGDHPDWDGLVWLQVHGKASDQFSGFPEITSICDTKICQVPGPSVFNPETRAYSPATWDGSFVEAFTTDPAWQIKEFVEDPVHGLAGIYPGSTLDKWDALEASKYFSEQVSDGNGGTHPRFSMNLTINEAKDIDEMMQYLAGSVNSYTEDIGNGVWRFKVDKPETPVMLFTEDNVFGEFQYSHSDIDTRFNDWRGTFLDESLDYETNTVRVFDQADIDQNGTKFTEIALIGCTHPQEALRRLVFRLRVSLNEFRSVIFETNRVGRYLNPLDTILVADGALNPDHLVKSTSRVASYSGTTVNLLRELRLELGVNYTVHFTTTDGEVVSRNITNNSSQRGDVTQLIISSPLPTNIMPQSAVALSAGGLAALPVAYRVISVERSENNEDNYVINAVQIDTGKWAAMDNVSQTDILAQESAIAIGSPTAPAGGLFQLVEYITDTQHKRVLEINWNRPASNFFDGYRVEYRLNNGPWFLANENQKDSFFELQNPEDGTYDFKITALDRRGVQSNPLIGQYVLNGSSYVTPPAHTRGPLTTRPPQGPYDGFRFTVTNANPPVTQVWEDGNWRDEVNLVTEGSQIGVENGATVGMTPAEEATLSQILVDVDDLYTTYGSTASAAASASAAQAYSTIAQTAATNSQTANTNAQSAMTAAQTARNDAITQATNAAGSASTAASSATTATNQANAAAGSATSASASANIATTQAGNAATSATAASTSASSATISATNAGTSAAAAQASAVSASTSALQAAAKNGPSLNYNPHFDQGKEYWFIGPSGTTQTLGTVVSAFQGRANVITGNYLYGYSESIPVTPGNKYELSISFYVANASSRHYLGVVPFDANGVSLTPSSGYYFAFSYSQFPIGWKTTSAINDLSSYPTATHVKIIYLVNYEVHSGTYGVDYIHFNEVTAREAASGSASAAATSASNASISATNAGNSASSALTSATNAASSAGAANTSAGNAATSASQASTSASNAAGSASTASTQATNAANSAGAAAGSASAASGSASTASTQATNAANSATAAQGFSVSASSSATDAIRTVASSMPGDFGEDGRFFAYVYGNETNASRIDQTYPNVSYPIDPVYGRILRFGAPNSGYLNATIRKRISTAVARRYRLTAFVRQNSSSYGALSVYVFIFGLSSDYSTLVYGGHLAETSVPSGEVSFVSNLNGAGVKKVVLDFVPQVGGTAPWLAPGIYFYNNTPGDNYNAGQPDILSMKVEDVTDSYAAAGAASAAATSASQASTSASAAGVSATSASNSANMATAQAGNASTSASAAAGSAANANTSAGNAANSASSAATFSNLAASFKNDVAALEGNLEFNRGFEAWSLNQDGSSPGVLTSGCYVSNSWEGGNYLVAPSNQYLEVYSVKTWDIDPNRTYKISANYGVWANGSPSNTARFYIGFVGLNALGAYVDHGSYGSLRYCITHGAGGGPAVLTDGQRVTPSVLVTGSGNDSWNKFPPGTVKIRLAAFMNYNEGDTSRAVNTYLGYMKVEDVTESLSAASSATAAAGSSVTAAQHAASALSYAVLSANVSRGAINPNPGFDAYPNSTGYPTNWAVYSLDSGYSAVSRVADSNGGWSMRVASSAGSFDSIFQYYSGGLANITPSGWYVVEADVTLESGTLSGTGIWCDCWSAPDIGYSLGAGLSFFSDPDVTGAAPGSGTAGKRYRYAKLIQVTSTTNVMRIYATNNYVGGPFGSTAGAKTLIWHYAAIRPATQAEIRDRTVLAPLQATVAVHSGAIATLQGESTAYWQVEGNAGSGADFFISARARSAYGSAPSSNVSFGAREIHLYNPSGANWKKALSIENGNAVFYGELAVGGTSGARTTINKNIIKVFDTSNVVRIKIGDLSL